MDFASLTIWEPWDTDVFQDCNLLSASYGDRPVLFHFMEIIFTVVFYILKWDIGHRGRAVVRSYILSGEHWQIRQNPECCPFIYNFLLSDWDLSGSVLILWKQVLCSRDGSMSTCHDISVNRAYEFHLQIHMFMLW